MDNQKYKKIIDALNEFLPNDNILLDEPMRLHTTFRVGGPADIFVLPSSVDELKKIFEAARKFDVPVTVLGNGSNVLVSDRGIRGVVIEIGKNLSFIRRDGATLFIGAGTILGAASKFAMKHGLTGLEFAVGIPGSVGGAAYMNAGAYDGEMKNVIKSVKSLDINGNLREREAGELGLGYRQSIFQSNGEIIVEIVLSLMVGDKSLIKEKMDGFTKRRMEKQPIELPSAGSTFKRPKGYYAGTLIENAGLKGLSCGGAQVSPKHAGFIVNTGNATASDIIELVREVQRRVMEKHGVMLEPEVRIIGE